MEGSGRDGNFCRFGDVFLEDGLKTIVPVFLFGQNGDIFLGDDIGGDAFDRDACESRIERDEVERHDFILTPCSPETFELLYEGADTDHPSCFTNLVENLAKHGIEPDDIPTTFNVFMNVGIGPDGELSIERPLSKPGDCIELRAICDLIVGLTSCSAEKSNDGSFGPIDFEVLSKP